MNYKKYRWVRGPYPDHKKYYDVGFNQDGTLHNPRGYPEAEILSVLREMEERKRACRSEAAKKAAATRRDRRSNLVYSVAQKIVAGHRYGPRHNCVVCGKGLGDPQSIERGIGSDCWQLVLALITQLQAAKETTAA
jgi:hypothetical protein